MADDHNGRVTMAVLATKLDAISDKLDTFCEKVQIDHDRLGRVEASIGETQRGVERLWQADEKQDKWIAGIDQRDKLWAGANSALIFIGSVLGMKFNL